MLHGHRSSYHLRPGYCAVPTSISLLAVSLRASISAGGRCAIIAAVTTAADAAGVLSMNLMLTLMLEHDFQYFVRA